MPAKKVEEKSGRDWLLDYLKRQARRHDIEVGDFCECPA